MNKRLSWAARLERAEKRDGFTNREVEFAGNWTKCAIGERYNFPKDAPLISAEEDRLGMDFMYAVESGNIPEAKRIYAGIQALP